MYVHFGISPCLFSLLVTVCAIWYFCKRSRILKFCKYQNGPTTYPLVGNLPFLFKKNILQGLISLKDKFGLPVNFWIFGDYYYITDQPEEIKILLGNTHSSFDKAPFYNDLIKVLLGNTFLMTPSAQVHKWKFERKTVQKSFSPSMWKNYAPVFNSKSEKLVEALESTNDFKGLFTASSHSVFEVFLENFMDISVDVEIRELMIVLFELQELLIKRSALGRIVPRWIFKHLMEEGKRISYLMNYFKSRIEEFIQEKREEFLENNDYVENTRKLKLIQMLFDGEETQFSNEDIYKQMFLISLTSIETTALTLVYTLVQLGMNPHVQEKVFKEVVEQIGDETEIDTDHLSKLKYMEHAIFEAIRLFPVIPLVGRHVTEDIDLGSKILPKGSNVMILPYLVHRNKTYWPDPEKYNPDRFSNKNDIQPGSYIPFLIGPRDCIGRHYSVAQVKVMVAKILRKYQVVVTPKSAKDLDFELYIVMKPGVNFDIHFTERNNNVKK